MEYVGVDYHKQYSYLAIMDERGKVIKQGRVVNDPAKLRQFLGAPEVERKAVLEAGRNWTVMHDWLEEEVKEVWLAHPKKVKAIAEAKIKTDKIDAQTLAHLLRSDLIPRAYVPGKATREIKTILRQRMFMVRVSTMVKNRIKTLIDRYPEVKRDYSTEELFTKQGHQWLRKVELSTTDRRLLDNELDLLEQVQGQIKEGNDWVESIGNEDQRVVWLRTVPGIGKFFGLLIASEIDDVNRFRNKEKLAAYAGLIPSVHSSGGKTYFGQVISGCNKYLRWAFIEAVWPAIRKDLELRELYERIKDRKGANIAKVAVAKRLSEVCYSVLKQRREYVENYSVCPDIILTKA
jgi:transposase